MAEIALPLIALGSLYIYSNKDRDNNNNNNNNNNNLKEGFINERIHNNSSFNELPNTNVINPNFPKTKPIDLKSKNYPKQYLNGSQSTDKFFDGKKNISAINTNLNYSETATQINGMDGNPIKNDEFKHNNMVPYFGSKVTGPSVYKSNQSILDNLNGNGSQVNKRFEQAPLFKPSENIQNVFGSPNSNNFYQERVLPSTKINNVLPWEQEKVGPGLGLGYTVDGADGFNSGMMDRKAWMPPTVNELRAKSNPKETFCLNGHEGPLESKVQNVGKIGIVEKNTPDTDFKLGADRWFTTATNLAPTQRNNYVLDDNNRVSTTNEYFGVQSAGGESKPNYYRGSYEPSQKPELCATEFTPAEAIGRNSAEDLQMRTDSYKVLPNARNENQQPDTLGVGGVNGTFKAILAPIIDILRPSRKENVIGNANQTGNFQTMVPSLPISNPNDKLKPTIKETTSDKLGLQHLNVSHVQPTLGGYENYNPHIKEQERNSANISTFGNIQGQSTEMNRTAWNNQHNNVNKSYESRPNPGGMDVFTGEYNMSIAKNQNDFINKRQPAPSLNANHLRMSSPSINNFGSVQPINELPNNINDTRMNPDILSAFKSNPYAQPLNSY